MNDGECPINSDSDTSQLSQFDYSNIYLAGVIVIITTIFGVYHLIGKLKKYLLDHFTVSMHLYGGMLNYYSEDKAYHWLLNWCTENLKTLQHYQLSTKSRVSDNGKEDETDFKIHPNFGTHIFRFKGQWIKLIREQTPQILCHEIPWECMTLITLRSNVNLLNEIMTEAKGLDRETDETKTSFFAISCGDWSMFGQPKKRRQLNSVILSKGMEQKILVDIKDFLDSEAWYMERGIPYRRGYLLHGPPGCGKSSLIKAIAGEIGYDICMLSLSSKDLTDDGLNQLMNTTPVRSIILLEDIDAAFKSREANCTTKEASLAFEGAGSSKVTFRGLLNALDGVASTEGRLIFMTTNYVERLDPALARPGRVDVKVLVGLPDADQILRMIARFYIDSDIDIQLKFSKIVKDMKGGVSMAMLQGLFMMHKTSIQGALDHAVEYFEEQHFNIKRLEKIEKEELERQKEMKNEEKEPEKKEFEQEKKLETMKKQEIIEKVENEKEPEKKLENEKNVEKEKGNV